MAKILPFLNRWLHRSPDPDLARSLRDSRNAITREAEKDRTIRVLTDAVLEAELRESVRQREQIGRLDELDEMYRMGGAGPWRSPAALAGINESDDSGAIGTKLRESTLPYIAQGAYGDAELMLNNIEWKRETSLSWLEFTRWGIQQVILIARLRCLKDPMLQRGMNVSAQYVFGRGVQITSENKAAAKILEEWRERNKTVLGHSALTELERAKYYDGNLFFCCFTDAKDSGAVNIRMIDAVEMMDVISNPDDSSEPWYYRRDWVQQEFDPATGTRKNVKKTAWYPALNYEPAEGDRIEEINSIKVQWESPVYHRKCGAIGKWHFGLPLVYAALNWANAVKRFLEDCMTIRNSLAQFSMILTTKGGQQALQGIKTQLSTTVGPNASLWDQNPPATAGAVFASGPGTTLQAFASKGAGGDPDDVRMYKLMVCMVFGLPESFFADMNTSNLATATSLDRPTELNFMEKQEVWVEDLTVLARYQLKASKAAPSGKLREAMKASGLNEADISAAVDASVEVTFPAIIEADVPTRVGAIVNAITLGSKMGDANGIDLKAGVGLLNKEFGIEDDVLDQQFPKATYKPDRTQEPEPTPATDPAADPQAVVKEAMARISSAVRAWEVKRAA